MGSSCLSKADIFAWEDTDGLLNAYFTNTNPAIRTGLDAAKVVAANQLIAAHGDDYDFIGIFSNFHPGLFPLNTVAGHYTPVKNDVLGLGFSIYDHHAAFGLAGSRVQGLMFFVNINHPYWEPTSCGTAILNHELMHRWGVGLPDLLDGREMQGTACGGEAHWNQKLDAQGSVMGMREWIGSNPAVHGPTCFLNYSLNTDIPGGTYSYPELYLMGMASPAEMDAGASELRHMDDPTGCASPYSGAISTWSSADVVAAAGPRIPDSNASQKVFRVAWIIAHEPGNPPTDAEKDKLISLLEVQQLDFNYSTLGRGHVSHNLIDPPTVYCTAGVSASGCQATLSAAGIASATEVSGFDLLATGVEGAKDGLFFFGTSGRQANSWGSGTSFQCVVPPVARGGLLTGSGTSGLCDGAFTQDLNALWCPTCPKPLHNPGAGAVVQAQLWYRDPMNTSNQTTSLSNAIEFTLCP
jgi:hypothetical protein